jgi:pSer/pThr/pTyr-binding forkhead associated (FHA) protein
MKCLACGRDLADPANFCPYCGARLPVFSPENTSVMPVIDEPTLTDELTLDELRAIDALPAGSALLIVAKGPGQGARFLLNEDKVTVGRHPGHEIFLDDITVSRSHAIFSRGSGCYSVTDAGSLNGTYVNRSLIDQSVPLRAGDEVQIGKFRMVFFSGPLGMR